MEFMFTWLHREREVLRRAPWLAVLLVLVGLCLGAAGAGALYQRQIDSAEQAVEAAKAQRDLWEDRYNDAVQPQASEGKKGPPQSEAKEAGLNISWPRTWGLIAMVALVLVLTAIFAPAPRGRNRKAATKRLEVPETPREMTAELLLDPTSDGPVDPKDAPRLPRRYLFGRDYERPALRSHANIHDLRSAPIRNANRVTDATAELLIRNNTSSVISGLSVSVDSIINRGTTIKIGQLLLGESGHDAFSIGPNSLVSLKFLRRRVNVAPEPPFFIPTKDWFLLSDGETYEINVCIDPGTGVVTRAVIQIDLHAYESFDMKIIGQAYWYNT